MDYNKIVLPNLLVVQFIFLQQSSADPDVRTLSLWIRIGIVLLVAIGVVVYLIVRRKTGERSQDAPVSYPTIDVAEIPETGRLKVLACDDPNMMNVERAVDKFPYLIGRANENDLSFPNDKAVSRLHARLEVSAGKFLLTQVLTEQEDGTIKPPTFGTFINEKPVGTEPVELFQGDTIRLGKRVRLGFEKTIPIPAGYLPTGDPLNEDQPKKATEDFGGPATP